MPKKENHHTFTLEFSDEMMDALLYHLDEKGSDLQLEMEDYLHKLYQKTVPPAIKKYLSAKQKKSAVGGAESVSPTENAF